MVKLKKFVIGASVAIVLMAAGFTLWVNRNVTTITLLNDTSDTVRVTGCGMDPRDIRPSVQTNIQTRNGDSGMACAIYVGSSSQYKGCLFTPTKGQEHKYYVSQMNRGVREMACLDRAR